MIKGGKKIFFCFFIFPVCILAQETKDTSFITTQEYGKKLYENPRNIGCIKCHGKNGESEVIATYKTKNKNKIIKTPKINDMDFETFKKALGKDKGIMPKYNLTEEEIKAIYLYISSRK
ncbi:c-type cytochrome [Helicobacter cappadocius]|uniref:C-type cytochrome n=1 Tax=Helicobacter cappadocius TaxID=3063998 RepID=A0AA90PKK3_9HELI|nr:MULTISPECIES: c-type cytochrome [unclassified Helicobacter]MDO7253743.1 c-type cytochrome [Helicobacter sp. faydin-H75]MDP2539671.1 c-type cytochrome [Helicobacter sp. faydin-H76]